MCNQCIFKALFHEKKPVCSKSFTTLACIRTPNQTVTNILAGLKIKCDHTDCKSTVPLAKLQDHVAQCAPRLASRVLMVVPKKTPLRSSSHQPQPASSLSTPLTPSKISLQDILESPLDKTPTHNEKLAATHLVKRMMKKSRGENSLEFPTGGQVIPTVCYNINYYILVQPMCLTRIPKPRQDSCSVLSKNLRNRSKVLWGVRTEMAGGLHSIKRQLIDQLKRQELLEQAGIGPKISEGEGLAMKAELSIPWNKLRHLRRYNIIMCTL